jgi:hypothetical protein
MTINLISKAERVDMIDLKYGEAHDDPQPFILTVTPQYVAGKMFKSVYNTSRSDMQAYVDRNADDLKALASNSKARGRTAEVL